MIRPMYSYPINISISDYLAIMQAGLNENILRMGKILTHFSGFTDGSFEPSLTDSSISAGAQWSVSLAMGKVFFPNAQAAENDSMVAMIPITHYGTQYIIVSHETQRMTEGLYAAQETPSDKTVYFMDKIRIRSTLGATMPSLGDNEMVVCRIDYSMVSDPVVTDLRIPYSAHWSLPYSISANQVPDISEVELSQNVNLREDTLGNRTMNTRSVSRNDDSIALASFPIPTPDPDDILNHRIEKSNGSSFTWEDLLFSAMDGDNISVYELPLHRNSYRVSYTDAFVAGLTSKWSESLPPTEYTGAPTVNVSTAKATAIISAGLGTVNAPNPICMIWASEDAIGGTDVPLWIGPFPSGNLDYNKGAQLNLTEDATSIYYKVVAFDQFGLQVGKTSGKVAVVPEWPTVLKMIVLNIMPDMVWEKSGDSFSTDTRLQGEGNPFISYINPSSTTTVITSIIYKYNVIEEDTDSSFSTITATPEGGDGVILFTLPETPVTTGTLEWSGAGIQVPPGKRLDFFAGSMGRSQGHLYLYGYSL